MVYLGKQIKTSNMLQQRAEGVEEKRRRLGRLGAKDLHLRRSLGETVPIAIVTFGVWVGGGIGRLPLPLVTGWRAGRARGGRARLAR